MRKQTSREEGFLQHMRTQQKPPMAAAINKKERNRNDEEKAIMRRIVRSVGIILQRCSNCRYNNRKRRIGFPSGICHIQSIS